MSGGEEHDEGGAQEEEIDELDEEPILETKEQREAYYHELVKARELEKKQAIAEGKMDDPLVAKRLEDAITMVGTCTDMCPRFERYRREREGNLFQWEMIPGTKRIDHKRAVKAYERAVGDKTLPSDLRPPEVLRKTLDYLFHELLPRGGFSATFNFIRDRTRAVRNDFTVQHENGPIAVECHDRCARFHILALHLERDTPGFELSMEDQQLNYTLTSLREFYEDTRGKYQAPTELEMRIYERLTQIRNQHERDDIPVHIKEHPVFKLTTKFRRHIQAKSAPIKKNTPLIVDAGAMEIFGELAAVLREQGSVVMIYLMACILERLFGKDTIDDIEAIRGDLTIPEIIDGVSRSGDGGSITEVTEDLEEDIATEPETAAAPANAISGGPLQPRATDWPTSNLGATSAIDGPSSIPAPVSFGSSHTPAAPKPVVASAFANLSAVPNAFSTTSVFGGSVFGKSAFGSSAPGTSNAFAPSGSAFGTTAPTPAAAPLPSPFSGALSASAAPISSASLPFPSPFPPTQPTNAPLPPSSSSPQFRTISTSATAADTAKPTLSFASAPPLNPAAPTFTPTGSPLKSVPTEPVLNPSQTPSTSYNGYGVPSILPESTPTSSHTTEPSNASGSRQSSFSFSKEPKETVGTPPDAHPPSSRSTAVASRLTINVDAVQASQDEPRTPLSAPPPLNRQQPVSLPSTPTLTPHPSAVSSAKFGSLMTNGLPKSNEALSPLNFSPNPFSKQLSATGSWSFTSTGSAPMSPLGLPQRKPSVDSKTIGVSPIAALSNGDLGGKRSSPLSISQTSTPTTSPSKSPAALEAVDSIGTSRKSRVDLDELALQFVKKSSTIRNAFSRWLQRTMDRAAWADACRRSDAYSQKIQRERASASATPSIDKKRRRVSGILPETPTLRKRVRKRMSSEYQPPRTDEELARRFQENHEEHERRWAQGSFLAVIRAFVKAKSSHTPSQWSLWLSMNQDSDATAIWLERKFDVPASGTWASDSIFSIPLTNVGATSAKYPGLIVFECTPLDGVSDQLERKYRILDDCYRLRNIIDGLPSKRYFVPSLVTISWNEANHADSPSDLSDMIKQLLEEGTLGSYSVFPMTAVTKDVDDKLRHVLRSVTLDTEGALVERLTLKGIFKLFQQPWKAFVSEWTAKCISHGEFDWERYGRVIDASVNLLNGLVSDLVGMVEIEGLSDPLPSFKTFSRLIADSESTYDAVSSFLEKLAGVEDDALKSAVAHVRADLKSHGEMDREFPCEVFVDHLCQLVLYRIEKSVDKESTSFYIPKAESKAALDHFRDRLRSSATSLESLPIFLATRSPKRQSTYSASESLDSSPSPAKRRRMSISDLSSAPPEDGVHVNGVDSPSPFSPPSTRASTVDDSAPLVTVAMLRSLTQDLKRKYVTSS
ncbi:hypothetical protein PLICRDRAFT_136628 [Plicaturopsis crispa FD-325 SS-3]|nr:hypothetical protein PLICRDRAFT_136628 [Plicaturopsis crispa FD-325 SS-3]